MRMTAVVECEAVWFEFVGDGGCQLMAAVALSHPLPERFETQLDIGAGLLVSFERIGLIGGRQVFRASSSRPAGVADPSASNPSMQVVGPSRGVFANGL